MPNGRLLLPALLMPLLLIAPVNAGAAAVCDILRGQLSGGTQTIGSTGESRQYAGAIRQANFEIRRVQSDLRRLGCSSGSITVIGGENEAACTAAERDLDDLQANKRVLMAKRDSVSRSDGSNAGGVNRQHLLTALDINGCNDQPADPQPVSTEPEALRTLPEDGGGSEPGTIRIFGAVSRQPDALLPAERDDGGLLLNGDTARSGGLRTLCVRTCDGAFFPISSDASPQRFRQDAETCARMCPGTPTALYYHSLRDQESADMVSAETGEPYTALPTAFAYRSNSGTDKAQCGCNLSAYYQDMAKQKRQRQSFPAQTYAAVTDIKTTDATGTDAAPQPVETQTLTPPIERPYDPTAKVRTVGPQFLADDSGRIDLQNPKSQGAQPLQQ